MRRSHAGLAAFSLLGLVTLGACADELAVGPDSERDPAAPFASIVDAIRESEGVYFLPPLSSGNPSPIGTFNPAMSPGMFVCQLDQLGLSGQCVGDPIAEFAPGSFTVETDQYSLSWDTNGRETGRFDTDLFYRLNITLRGAVAAWIDLDPQKPNGPGQSDEDAYAFRVGETIPVKMWLSAEAFCVSGLTYVDECITGAIIDQQGASLALTDEGRRLGLDVPPNSLPSDNPVVTAILERIDPDDYFTATGEECIPLFDAPQFAECFRITTVPELPPGSLINPATISICVDTDQLGLTLLQQAALVMIRYFDGTDDNTVNGVYEALPQTDGNCPVQTAGLLPVPESGIARFAAQRLNQLAKWLLPQQAIAQEGFPIRLGAFSSSFSNFRFALPGEMVPTDGDGTLIQNGSPNPIDATFTVNDYIGNPVPGAIVHFTSNDGTVSAAVDTAGSDGVVATTWTLSSASLGTPGTKNLTASALGLVAANPPDESASGFLMTESVDLQVTVVGPPAQMSQSPTSELSGVAGSSVGDLTVTVLDAGSNPVAGATVDWSGDGAVSDGTNTVSQTTTGSDGTTTVEWTLRDNPTGDNTMTASVGTTLSVSFTADAAAGPITQLDQSGATGGPYPPGFTVSDLQVIPMDANDNPVPNSVVTWAVELGGGSISGTSPTDANGSATAAWKLGAAEEPNRATATVGGLTAIFNTDAQCFPGYGSAQVDGTFGAAEWACADSLNFDANISGGSTPATVYWQNDGSNLYMAVRVAQSSPDKVNSLRIDFDNDGDDVTEAWDDVIGIDSETGFYDHHLPPKCVNRNQSGCGDEDGSKDGAGAVANDGTYTVFELVHPLNSGENTDLAVPIPLLPGTTYTFGFFLTLQSGNGAQGNTQVPAFRQYLDFTVVGF